MWSYEVTFAIMIDVNGFNWAKLIMEAGNVVDWMLKVGVSLQIRSIAAFIIASHICSLFAINCISVNPRFKCSQISSDDLEFISNSVFIFLLCFYRNIQ